MDLIRFAIRNPVTVSVGVLLVLLFGLISLDAIPIQMTPQITTTTVSVTTRWEGATPQQIERDIVEEQEEKLKGINNLTKMISVSRMGEAEITLEFSQNTPKDLALRQTSDKLREVPDYPENVDEPIIEAVNPQDRDKIAWIIVSTTDEDYDIRKLQDFLEDRVKPQFERVPGISEVEVLGGFERELQIRVDPQALAQRGIPPGQLLDRLQAQNRDASAGELAEGKLDIRIRSVGRFHDVQQVENILISNPGEPVVRVKDVADVKLTHKEPMRYVRNKGRTVLAMNANNEVGSNVISVMSGLKKKLEHVKQNVLPEHAERLGLDGELNAEQVYDQTIYIYQALGLVRQNLWVGGLIAMMVLLLFLRSVRSTLIIGLAIPVSIIGTFVVMAALGRSVNVVSLAGLAFAVGMVVDNAIVVLENIDRHRRIGDSPAEASHRATKEVWGAVLASTLTTISVFLPIVLMTDEAGQLFRDISLAICAAVLLSLIVSITVIPTAAARWLRVKREPDPAANPATNEQRAASQPRKEKAWKRIPKDVLRLPARLPDALSALMSRLARSWLLRPAIIIGLVAAAIAASYALMPPTSYLPSGNRNLVFARMFTPPGYNLQQQERIGHRVERELDAYWEAYGDPEAAAKLPEVPSQNPFTGEPTTVQPPPLENFFFVAVRDMMFMGGISSEPTRVRPIEDLMNDAIGKQPGVIGFANQMPLFRIGLRSGDALELEIAGPNLDEVERVAGALYQRYGQQFGFRRIQPSPFNFNLPGTEIRVDLKPVEATDVGLNQRDINAAVRVFGDGAIIGNYLDANDNIDLKVLAKQNGNTNDAAYFANLPVATPAAGVVPLHSVAKIQRTVAPQEIHRVEEQRAVTLQIRLPGEMPLEAAMGQIRSDVEAMRADGTIPPTVSTNLAGSAAKLTQVKQNLLGAWSGFNAESFLSLLNSRMFLALVVVFLLMAALFESWLYPFVIMFSVPLATVGGFLGLFVVRQYVPEQQLDVLTMLGFVILIGIVVNNAILIVHQTLNLIRGEAEVRRGGELVEKLEPKEAIAEAVRTRVRPIFMSMMTSVGGMLPLVLFPGAGSELYRGLGSVVVGGLAVSTVFTLVLVPLLLSVMFDLRKLLLGAAAKADQLSPTASSS